MTDGSVDPFISPGLHSRPSEGMGPPIHIPCTECGKKIPPDTRICRFCSAVITAPPDIEQKGRRVTEHSERDTSTHRPGQETPKHSTGGRRSPKIAIHDWNEASKGNAKTEARTPRSTAIDEKSRPASKAPKPRQGNTLTENENLRSKQAPKPRRPPTVFDGDRHLVGWLITFSHAAAGSTHSLYLGVNPLGRSAQCDIRLLQSAHIADEHAKLTVRPDGQYAVMADSDSSRLMVNRTAVKPGSSHGLMDGDRLTSATTVLRIYLLDPTEKSSISPEHSKY